MNRELSQKIKLIRVVAVVLILITHILQEYSIKGFEWTYSGVQIFLILSGLLLGQKDVVSWKKWFYRRALRIILPYYIVLVLTAILYFFFLGINIVDLEYLVHFTGVSFLIFRDYPFWGGHLWFITAIILCYSVFPILQMLKTFITSNNLFCVVFFCFVPAFLFILFYKTSLPYRLAADIYSFVVGYALSAIIFRRFKYVLCLTILLLALMSVADFYLVGGSVGNVSLWHEIFEILWPWKKILIALAIISLCFFGGVKWVADLSIVNNIDRISYEIYLTHKNYILGKLSLLFFTSYFVVNITISLILTYLTSLFVFSLTKAIVKKFPRTELNTV